MSRFSLLTGKTRHAPNGLLRRLPAARRVLVLVAVAILVPGAYARVASGQETGVTEHQVKAAFLYNFAKFVEWPASAFPHGSSPFLLCVMGREPFLTARDMLTGKTVKGRSVEVVPVEGPTDAAQCHMLFLGATGARAAAEALSAPANGHTLVVGEASDVTRRGTINLLRLENRIRFEIDRSAAERSGFRFSAQLLKLAIPAGTGQ